MDELKATGLCPICRCDIAGLVQGVGSSRQCPRCATWYHLDCWEYGGGCGVYGCEPSAQPRRCAPPPRPAGPVWERISNTGAWMALGMTLFMLGTALGFLGWCIAGPLALPVILLLGWCTDSRDAQGPSTFRRGVLFGPILMVVLPFPFVYLASIPLGIALMASGQALRVAVARPMAAGLFALAIAGTLSWSHATESEPVPFALDFTVSSTFSEHEIACLPIVLGGPAVQPLIRRLGRGGRGEQRLLLVGRHLVDATVTRAGGALVVEHGARPAQQIGNVLFLSPFTMGCMMGATSHTAVVLPAGPERVELHERSVTTGLLGSRLDHLLTEGGSGTRQIVRAYAPTATELEAWQRPQR